MRVLVVVTSPAWTAGTRLLVQLAAGLAARGDVVAVATAFGSATERAVEQEWPRLSLRSVSGASRWRQMVSLRGIVTALRPDALLVGSEHDSVLAALALGKRGGIVRRLRAEERLPRDGVGGSDAARPGESIASTWSWRGRLARARAHITVWGDTRLALSWPAPAPSADDHPPPVHRLPHALPAVVLAPGEQHDDSTAAALRALAHLRTRRPALRVLLVGDTAALQQTRLHAAALDLATAIEVVPLDALLHHALGHACAAWVTAPGDAGALATLVAMQQQLPAITAIDAPGSELVTHGATGFLTSADRAGVTVAELARLLADGEARHAMGAAAAARARRAFSWDTFVDDAALLLARAAGMSNTRVTRRPALTPA